ncbi:hypothetical protein [Paenibacillus pinistramenti]|uniref:hypothetical protein n=1 Tax=Paenibacillus pinistramenti TaxID=1768003 RepID=UPI0011082915|nr:hypothetical protein [Paenibacillus pinistramenti]
MKKNVLLAGAGKAVIELSDAVFPIKQFTGIHDDLQIRVVLIQNEVRLALVSVEITSLPLEAINEFKEIVAETAELNPENVWICATHTFSAPHLSPRESRKTDEDHRIHAVLHTSITNALKKAAAAASQSLSPAKAGAAKGKCLVNINRNIQTERGWWLGRNEEGTSIKDVNVMVFQHLNSNEPIAILFNYDIQSSIMDGSISCEGGKLISGDLAGEASRHIEQEYSGNVVASFFTGSAGDQAPMIKAVYEEDIHDDGFVLVEQFGRYLGQKVIEQVKLISEYEEVSNVSIRKKIVRCPEQEMSRSTKEIRPELHYSFHLTGSYADIPIEAIRIGEVLLIGTQPELNSGYGADLKALFPDTHIFIITMVNGGAKYLPEEMDYERITYTAMNTRLGRGSSEVFKEGFISLVQEINQ